MAMELIAADHLDVFYSPADARRAKRGMLERVIRFLPWMAIIDSYQHWLYTHPKHTPEERKAQWIAIHQRFTSPILDWQGLDQQRAYLWHRQLHIFHYAFYYIEYGIAQLGALQLWLQARENPARALKNYRNALALGGTKPLPELFKAAEIKFEFSRSTLEPLMKALGEEMAKL
jgi:oligoendopeptidase F